MKKKRKNDKKFNNVYIIIIAVLFLIIVFDLFFKIEYSSKSIEHTLNSLNQSIYAIANNKDSLSIQGKAFLNDNIIKINDVTNFFLSERSISFIFTVLNVILLSIGFYLFNSFNSIKDNLENQVSELNNLHKKLQIESKFYSLFNRLNSRFSALKYSEKSISTDTFNGLLRYILTAELKDIENAIKLTKDDEIIIDKSVYDFGLDILNEIKSFHYDSDEDQFPVDLGAMVDDTLSSLKLIVELGKMSKKNL